MTTGGTDFGSALGSKHLSGVNNGSTQMSGVQSNRHDLLMAKTPSRAGDLKMFAPGIKVGLNNNATSANH